MATSKKTTKTGSSGGNAPKSGGKRASASAKGGERKSKSAAPAAAARRKFDPRRRLIAGIVLFITAVFSAFGYFGVEALVIDLLLKLERGLVGYGYWVTPIMLLWAGVILLLHHNMPVRLRTGAALVLPMLIGGLIQAFTGGNQYTFTSETIGTFWLSGIEMTSGGLLGGLTAALLVTAVAQIGAVLVLLVLIIADLMILTRKSPSDVAQIYREANERHKEKRALRSLDLMEDGDYMDPEDIDPSLIRRPKHAVAPAPGPGAGRRTTKFGAYDVPVDGYEPEQQTAPAKPKAKAPEISAEDTGRLAVFEKKKSEPLFQEKKSGFFDQFFGKEPEIEEPAADYQHEPMSRSTAVELEEKEPERLVDMIRPAAPKPAAPAAAERPVELPPIEDSKTKAARERREQAEAAAEVAMELEEGMKVTEEYIKPPVELLQVRKGAAQSEAQEEIESIGERLNETIKAFGIDAHVVGAVRGPTVTRYELQLKQGVKLSRVTNLADDIALTLGAKSVRIAPIPGKSLVVGVEVPNKLVSPVGIRDVLGSDDFQNHKSNVAFALGKDISGRNVIGNISKLPHMLIAGTTGSGKSVCTNSIIISMLYKSSPEQVRLIMVDPKMVELSVYNGIPHLLIPVVTDPKKAAGALQWAVTEMLKRYRTFSEYHVRDLESYNQLVESDVEDENKPMPQIVIMIDELADLMLVASKEVEEAICRLAQMGRAAGMHLIIATQRPSTDVITGLMKANIPSRIALSVASGLESRIILDVQGAEKLIGNGDMLFSPVGSGKPQRVQGCYISDEEVASVVEFIKERTESDYDQSVIAEVEHNAENAGKGSGKKGGSTLPDSTIPEPPAGGPTPDDADPMLNDAIEVVVETGMASVSMLQRRLKLGYSRAARLVDQMEEKGVVGPFQGSKPREVLMNKERWMELKMNGGSLTELDQAKAMSEATDAQTLSEELDMPPFEV